MARTRRNKKPRKTAPIERLELTISDLAHRGDGVAKTEHGTLFVPNTLAAEKILADVQGDRAACVEVVTPSRHRVEAACPVASSCGGCSLQHLEAGFYADWKRSLVVDALKRESVSAEVAPLETLSAGTRRRATFSLQRTSGAVKIGFHSARSHTIVDIDQCLIVTPAIENALPLFKKIGSLLAPRRGSMRLHVLETESGLDIRVDDFGDFPDFTVERQLMDLAVDQGLARLSLGDDILIEPQKPILTFGTTKVTPAPGGFTQATRNSEEIMASLVLNALDGCKHVADLFCGSGTFTLRLAETMRVHGVEGDARAIAALEQAARSNPALKPVTTEKRDLFMRPLMKKELMPFDAIVLDPPRAGAKEQIAELAKSDVTKIVYVSCSPASFARDAAILCETGFTLSQVIPVDQFLFSHHIELVGLFEKEKTRHG